MPFVVRLGCAKAHIARKMPGESGLKTAFTEGMEKAVRMVLEASQQSTH